MAIARVFDAIPQKSKHFQARRVTQSTSYYSRFATWERHNRGDAPCSARPSFSSPFVWSSRSSLLATSHFTLTCLAGFCGSSGAIRLRVYSPLRPLQRRRISHSHTRRGGLPTASGRPSHLTGCPKFTGHLSCAFPFPLLLPTNHLPPPLPQPPICGIICCVFRPCASLHTPCASLHMPCWPCDGSAPACGIPVVELPW
jgi:hypothetical protein